MQNNILHQHLVKHYGEQMLTCPRDRVNGKSTGLALEALGKAIRSPKQPIYIYDHDDIGKRNADLHSLRLAQDIVGKLQLVGFTFKHNTLGYYVVYDLYPTEKL